MTTSKKVATLASKDLKKTTSTKSQKSVDGSALSQAKSKKSSSNKKK